MQRSWKDLVGEIVDRLPSHFELRDVLRYEPELEWHYPNNKHIGAKIRQTLQILRDQDVLVFERHGRYSKARNAKPRFSPLIDLAVSPGLTSGSQIARLVLETWAELNLFCLNCDCDALVRLAANTPVADFECGSCNTRYQIKGKNGRFGPTITGAAYTPLIEAVRSGKCPEYVLIEYDRRFSSVVFGVAVRGSSITEDRVVPRAPLHASARRAGWIGCNLRLEGLPTVSVVEPNFVDSSKVRLKWAGLKQ
jgi:hypothetical protein